MKVNKDNQNILNILRDEKYVSIINSISNAIYRYSIATKNNLKEAKNIFLNNNFKSKNQLIMLSRSNENNLNTFFSDVKIAFKNLRIVRKEYLAKVSNQISYMLKKSITQNLQLEQQNTNNPIQNIIYNLNEYIDIIGLYSDEKRDEYINLINLLCSQFQLYEDNFKTQDIEDEEKNKQISNYKSIIDKYKLLNNKLKNDIKKLEGKLSELQGIDQNEIGNLNEIKLELEKERSNSRKKDNIINDLKKENNILSKKCNITFPQNREQNIKLQRSDEFDILSLENIGSKKGEEKLVLTQENSIDIKNKISLLETELSIKKQENLSLIKENEQVKNDLLNKCKEIELLQSQFSKKEEEFELFKSNNNNEKEIYEKNNQELINKLKNDINEKDNIIKGYQSKNEEYEKMIESLKSESNNLKKKLSQRDIDNKTLLFENNQLKGEKKEYSSNLSLKSNEIDNYLKMISEKDEMIKELEDKIKQNEQISSLENEIEQLKKNNKLLIEENEDLRQSKNLLQQSVNQSQLQLSQSYMEKIKNLENQLVTEKQKYILNSVNMNDEEKNKLKEENEKLKEKIQLLENNENQNGNKFLSKSNNEEEFNMLDLNKNAKEINSSEDLRIDYPGIATIQKKYDDLDKRMNELKELFNFMIPYVEINEPELKQKANRIYELLELKQD